MEERIEKVAYDRGYRVTNEGVLMNPEGKPLKGSLNHSGYFRASIRSKKKGKKRPVFTHRLMAFQKFGDAMFEPGIQVRHLDRNSKNNSCDNIAIGTARDNTMDVPADIRSKSASIAARAPRGVSAKRRKYSDAEVAAVIKDWEAKVPYSTMVVKHGIPHGTIHYLVTDAKRKRLADS